MMGSGPDTAVRPLTYGGDVRSSATIEARTTAGRVQGSWDHGIARFLGVPYAAAPVGPLRFSAPARPSPWSGTRPALTFGPTPPRPIAPDGAASPFDALLCGEPVAGDEWLNLNVWTPDPQVKGMPVMVWIFGGAFITGAAAGSAYDGAAFARDGIVCVTLNYRLGVEGFGYLPDAPVPANRGLLDQVMALEWVRENIASFGGDPGNITVFGESAGGISILALLSTGRDLFARAIVQSGSAHIAQTTADASLVASALAEHLGHRSPTCAYLQKVAPDVLAQKYGEVHQRIVGSTDIDRYGETTIQACGMTVMPIVDGDLLTKRPIDALSAGAGYDVPLVIGTTSEEFRLLLLQQSWADSSADAALAKSRLTTYGAPSELYDAYARLPALPLDRRDVRSVFCAVMTDRLLRIPACRVAEARQNAAPTYLYELVRRSPVHYPHPSSDDAGYELALGAAHLTDIPFVWNSLDHPSAAPVVGQLPPQALADAMHRRWAEFATTGTVAGWECYDVRDRAVMTFTDGGTAERGLEHLVLDPRAAERRRWDGYLSAG